MSLQADLSVKLDTSGLVTTLLNGLSSASGNLNGVTLPASGQQLSDAQQPTTSLDTSGIGSIVGQVVASIGPLLGSFPGTQEVLAPLT
ncbi:MAG TPA: hypothetical protein VF290_20900, partial [Pyrinomonadaceae bacterium]